MTQIREKSWFGQPAISIESSQMRATFVPTLGAKIVELTDLTNGFEWLVPPLKQLTAPIPYGAVFTEQDMSGWDDMFPTIDACTFISADGRSVSLPDHGEVWALEWDVTAKDETLHMHVEGVALPYILKREVEFAVSNQLLMRYTLNNTGKQELPCFWAAHPQFICTPTMRIILPPQVTHVYNAYERPFMGSHGTIHSWNTTQLTNGTPLMLDRELAGDVHECHKVYVTLDTLIDHASLHDIKEGNTLTLAWSDPVNYLSILVDTRMFNPRSIIALEPATAFYDDLTRAMALNRIPMIAPGDSAQWQITITLNKE